MRDANGVKKTGHGIGDGVIFVLHSSAELLFEEPRDSVPRLHADVIRTGRHDGRATEDAVLVEQVHHTGVADRRQLRTHLWLHLDREARSSPATHALTTAAV
jgi:hypothetical protein